MATGIAASSERVLTPPIDKGFMATWTGGFKCLAARGWAAFLLGDF